MDAARRVGHAAPAVATLRNTMLSRLLAMFALVSATSTFAEVKSYLDRERLFEVIKQETVAKKFDLLDKRAEEFRLNKTRSASGVWQQSLLHGGIASGLESSIADEATWQSMDRELSAWSAGRGRSLSALIIYAQAIQQNAWRLRGRGFASTTTAAGREAFQREMRRARSILDNNKARLQSNPEWYAQRISLATYLSEGDSSVERLFLEAVKLEPFYYENFFVTLFHYSPRWGGSHDAMAAFMNRALKYATPAEGASMYARLAWYAEGGGDHEVIYSKAIDWKTMSKSFEDVLRVFPDDWNAQQFLMMACDRPDVATAKRIVPYVKEGPSEALLRKNVPVFEMCRDLALGKGEPFLMRDPTTGEMRLVR